MVLCLSHQGSHWSVPQPLFSNFTTTIIVIIHYYLFFYLFFFFLKKKRPFPSPPSQKRGKKKGSKEKRERADTTTPGLWGGELGHNPRFATVWQQEEPNRGWLGGEEREERFGRPPRPPGVGRRSRDSNPQPPGAARGGPATARGRRPALGGGGVASGPGGVAKSRDT